MILQPRNYYYPFTYPTAFDFWHKQQKMFWLVDEISLYGDVEDWRHRLTLEDKNLISAVLKGFTQVETIVNNYWLTVASWFPHPEITMAATAMANSEGWHQDAYSKLQITLGDSDFKAYLHNEEVANKINSLILKQKTIEDKALSLAIFSGFTEGVSLFSQFAILLNFSRFGLMKGLGQIISFSIRDETHHANFGAWLFNTLKHEYPEFWVDDFKKHIYEAARHTVQLEDAFIDYAFNYSSNAVRDLTPTQLRQYIRLRTNTRLNDLGLKTNWKNLDNEAIKDFMAWFTPMTALGHLEHHDFFSVQGTAYSSGVSFKNIFD